MPLEILVKTVAQNLSIRPPAKYHSCCFARNPITSCVLITVMSLNSGFTVMSNITFIYFLNFPPTFFPFFPRQLCGECAEDTGEELQIVSTLQIHC